jgi:hypothetical protein
VQTTTCGHETSIDVFRRPTFSFAGLLIAAFLPDINRSPQGVENYNCGEGKSATFITN